jgi:hypothetical protein
MEQVKELEEKHGVEVIIFDSNNNGYQCGTTKFYRLITREEDRELPIPKGFIDDLYETIGPIFAVSPRGMTEQERRESNKRIDIWYREAALVSDYSPPKWPSCSNTTTT